MLGNPHADGPPGDLGYRPGYGKPNDSRASQKALTTTPATRLSWGRILLGTAQCRRPVVMVDAIRVLPTAPAKASADA